ncbi:RiPP maturation radical SAM C-methyltransferase [Priestia megaterium]|uniref:RiPP maturation radical SAM C-methyltransferase n=1 Tax=Priestia megaterium TaxID=1404 RepID=UPI000CA2C4FC|nr:RiPP maturation radical SAM C-methyltransferase [Priestia megaterium]AUO14635.1 RiPP maturation radical SAM protein 1 [Priestia megaterium]
MKEIHQDKSIVLVTMPWNTIDMPSIQLGLMTSVIKEKFPEMPVKNVYGNLLWAEHLLSSDKEEIDFSSYEFVSEFAMEYGIGEWVFKSALYDEPYDKTDYLNYIKSNTSLNDNNIETLKWMYLEARNFVDKLANEIVELSPKVVGFTTTFMQNVPSLALAKVIKEKMPEVFIIFGGANCDGIQGEALHRNFRFIDFIVRGEGEIAFPELIQQIFHERDPQYNHISGLCHWKGQKSVANAMRTSNIPFNDVPFPLYDDYFDILGELEVGGFVEPKMSLESSRGCWWGQKHQCTFCGLNGSMMTYRSKSPEIVLEKIKEYVEKYQVLDLFMIDNIMDLKYFKELLPKIRDLNWDLHMFYEVKSNLSEKQVSLFNEAGIKRIQPGIENLSTNVLKLMKKGVTGIQNVQLLKWSTRHSIEVSWNLLYGFPGEKISHYKLQEMKKLSHVQPPDYAIRILLERFSPNFEDKSIGIKNLGPARFYSYIYNLDASEIKDIAYIFDSEPEGLTENEANMLREIIQTWQDAYPSANLTYTEQDNILKFTDSRPNMKCNDLKITNALYVRAHQLLESSKGILKLQSDLENEGWDIKYPEEFKNIEAWCNEMSNCGLLYNDDDKFLSLAIPENSQRIKIINYDERNTVNV